MAKYIRDIEDWSEFSAESPRAVFIYAASCRDEEYFRGLLPVLTREKPDVEILCASAFTLDGMGGDLNYTGRSFFIISERHCSDLSGLYRDVINDNAPLGVDKYVYELSTYRHVDAGYIVHVISNTYYGHEGNPLFNFSAASDGEAITIRIRRHEGEGLVFSRVCGGRESRNYTVSQRIKPNLSVLWR